MKNNKYKILTTAAALSLVGACATSGELDSVGVIRAASATTSTLTSNANGPSGTSAAPNLGIGKLGFDHAEDVLGSSGVSACSPMASTDRATSLPGNSPDVQYGMRATKGAYGCSLSFENGTNYPGDGVTPGSESWVYKNGSTWYVVDR